MTDSIYCVECGNDAPNALQCEECGTVDCCEVVNVYCVSIDANLCADCRSTHSAGCRECYVPNYDGQP